MLGMVVDVIIFDTLFFLPLFHDVCTGIECLLRRKMLLHCALSGTAAYMGRSKNPVGIWVKMNSRTWSRILI